MCAGGQQLFLLLRPLCAVQALGPLPKGKLAVAGVLLVVSGVALSLALTGFDFSIVPARVAQVRPSASMLLVLCLPSQSTCSLTSARLAHLSSVCRSP